MPIHQTDIARIVENEGAGNEYVTNSNLRVKEFHYRGSTLEFIKAENVENIDAVVIQNCHVKELNIHQSKIGKIIISDSSIESIQLTAKLPSTKIRGRNALHLTNEQTVRGIEIDNTQIRNITIQNIYLPHINISQDCTISTLHFDGCVVDKFIATYTLGPGKNHIEEVQIHSCIFQHEFEINDCAIGRFTAHKTTIASLGLCRIKSDLVELSLKSSSKAKIIDCSSLQFNLGNGNYTEVVLLGGIYEELNISPTTLNSLFIGSSYHKGSKIRQRITKLDFSHYPKFAESVIRINDIKIDTLDLSEFNNLGKFELSNADIERCDMELTRLGEAVFNSISFKSLYLHESIIDQARFANIEWPKRHEMIKRTNSPQEQNNKEERKKAHIKIGDAYRQLKIVCLNAQDKVNAIAFQRHEMDQIWRIANLTWSENIGNWLILGSNKLFSNFGQSLSRPLLWLVAFHSIIFAFLWNSFDLANAVVSRCEVNGCNPKIESLSIFAATLNPAHDHIILGIDIFGFTDFLMRISASFFIYYFIRATRKFNISI